MADTAQIKKQGLTERIFVTTLVLSFVATMIIFVMGISMLSMNKEIKELGYFLDEASNIRENFERSLTVYTETTQEVIRYLLQLRPDTEDDYIEFISRLEDLGAEHGLDLKINTLNASSDDQQTSNVLTYKLAFYGNQTDLISFLGDLEDLPYFTKVTVLNYKDPDLLGSEGSKQGNIEISIDLHIKT